MNNKSKTLKYKKYINYSKNNKYGGQNGPVGWIG